MRTSNFKKVFLWMIFVVILCFNDARRSMEKIITKELDRLFNKNYDPRLRAGFGDGPLMIGINIDFTSLNTVSEVTMDYSISLYLYQIWKDKRLAIKRRRLRKMNVSLTSEVIEQVWLPDTYFVNDRESFIHSVTRKNHLLRIRPDGTVFYAMRISPHLTCLMDFTRFPMDEQTCELELESYAYVSDDIQFFLNGGKVRAITGINELKHPEFKVLETITTVQNKSLTTGIYSRITTKFRLRRTTVHYILQIYTPCASITGVSWLSFWLDDTAISARTALGITSLLTIITIGINNRNTLPQISYLSALEIYCLACFTFVLLSFVELIAVNWFIIEKATKKVLHQKKCSLEKKEISRSSSIRQRQIVGKKQPKKKQKTIVNLQSRPGTNNRIDRTSQICFPSAFLIFNLFYWVYFIYL